MEKKMGDLISRKALMQDVEDTIKFSECVNHEREIIDCIQYEPSEDAEIMRHGKWECDHLQIWCRCSVCGEQADAAGYDEPSESNYCPHCGARMDLK